MAFDPGVGLDQLGVHKQRAFGFGRFNILVLLRKMPFDGFIGIWAVSCCVGVSKPRKGVKVTRFDSIEPRLLDWEAKTGVLDSN